MMKQNRDTYQSVQWGNDVQGNSTVSQGLDINIGLHSEYKGYVSELSEEDQNKGGKGDRKNVVDLLPTG